MEDDPSPAEGNGLENRQACKSVRGFEARRSLEEAGVAELADAQDLKSCDW